MGLRDNVLKSLRTLFDAEREDRIAAESPSAQAMRNSPASIYSVWGREDVGGLLSISQNLMDRYADYEAMQDYPDIRTAIEYFASDATQPNADNGRTIWVTSRDAAIVGSANAMLKRRLRLEDDAFSLAFGLCSMGNDFEEVLVTENGVVGLNHLPAPTVRRIERLDGTLIGFVQDISGRFTAEQDELRRMLAGQSEVPAHVALFEDWQIVQFRLRGHARRSPYGAAVQEPARWIWKRLVMLEDAVMIYKLTRSPARNAFYVDVTDVPPAKREAFLQKQKRDLKKKSMVDPRTGRLDMRYNPLCLAAATKVPLLDGSERDMVELAAAFERGEEQWIYSTDLSREGALTPGKVVWAGKTRCDAQIVKVTLDNGESIKATPDHKFIRRNGEFVEAGSLKPGDSLMPFRRRVSDKKVGDTLDGYELVYDPAAKRSFYTHRVVAKTLLGKVVGDGRVTHHVDFNPLNNSPKNLQLMEWEAHLALHREAGFNGGNAVAAARRADPDLDQRMRAVAARNITAYNISEEKRARTSEQNRARDSGQYIRRYNASKKHKADNTIRRAGRLAFWAVPENRASVSEKNKLVYSDEFVDAIRALVAEEPDAGAPRIAAIANECGFVELLKKANPNKTKKIKNVHREMLRWMARDLGFKSFADFKQLAPCDNHKVVSVEWLAEREDTYCITVDETHTFATSAGVFVKNSMDEDYVIAVSDGRNLARVEVLAGPDYQNIDDVGYFQRKLHGALKVPRAYLGQDAPIQGKAILSSEDVRAARVTLQVQKELRNGIERLVRIDQAARGYPNAWQTDFEVCMTVPSGIYELAAMEVKNARADFASRVQPYVSMRWIREHVFKLSDEEIAAIETQSDNEAMHQAEMQQKQQALMSAPPIAADPMGQVQPGAPGVQGAPGAAPAGAPAGAPPPPPSASMPFAPPSRSEQIRNYDAVQRLEEKRDKMSRQNHQRLVDQIHGLMENDKSLSDKVGQAIGLVNDLRSLALRNSNGHVSALPSAARRF